ncbi:hypothetical protein K4K61_007186 [Colletotrichum sp. SAR11_59]|nr:hypothetical protein K4K61_007186 [Colletotrichum sp. SAR11_59]
MHFIKTLIPLALFTVPILAVPTPATENGLEARAPPKSAPKQAPKKPATVTCTPTKSKAKEKKFVVEIEKVKIEATNAGFAAGKSSYPHVFGNQEKINWGVEACTSGKPTLYEYPVFWQGYKGAVWQKDEKVKNQNVSPLRVVYANSKGSVVYCGVMTHVEVSKDYRGSKEFKKCV